METRSNHVLVGGVVLALLVALLAFIVWLAGFNTVAEQRYDIFFKTSVDGLAKGSPVNFSGVPVGKIQEIKLEPKSPEFVRVRISVDRETPILQGTTATIAGVGFTGVSQINLDGAIKGAPPIVEPGPYGVPVIPTKPGALGELLNSAPELLNRISALTDRLAELLNDKNQKSIGGILANVDRLSGDLADRGPEIAASIASPNSVQSSIRGCRSDRGASGRRRRSATCWKVAMPGQASATESRLGSRSSTKAVGWPVWATRPAAIGPLGPELSTSG